LEAPTLPIDVADAQLPAAGGPVRRPAQTASALDGAGVPALERREALYRRLLSVADVLAASVGLLVVVTVAGADRLRPASLLCLPAIVVASKVMGLYDRDELLMRKTTIDEAPAIFQLATISTLLFWLLEGVFVAGSLGKGQVLVMWATIFVLTMAGRALARRGAKRLAASERVLVIGDETSYRRLKAKLRDERVSATLVGRLSGNASPADFVGAEFTVLRQLVSRLEVHRIVIASAVAEGDSTLEMIRAAKALGVRVSVLPRILEVVGSATEYDNLQGLPILGVRRFGLSRSSKLLKRAFDLAGAGFTLLVLGPFMLVIAGAIRLDSSGTVFFRQTRVGRDGKPFRIFKFRSMCTGADAMKAQLSAGGSREGLFKMPVDPRVTRVGRLLRAAALDELPQLVNVVRGEMSLVGPRPLVVDEDRQITGWDRGRLTLTPGMTGHWQILGARVPLAEMVKIDYLYVAGWSLWADVKLLVRTVPYMLARRGM
jgi:exopolysaccharide biosynthesis polyprenyl glycosylphosphotransferase